MRRSKPDRNELVDVHFDKLVHQTDKAFLVIVEDEETWVGKSEVDNADDLEAELALPVNKRGDVDTIRVPKWLAVNNGWVDDD